MLESKAAGGEPQVHRRQRREADAQAPDRERMARL